jgi:hypothetical protein
MLCPVMFNYWPRDFVGPWGELGGQPSPKGLSMSHIFGWTREAGERSGERLAGCQFR